MYRYESCGCCFISEGGERYAIDMTTPFVYADETAASRDTTIYRFRKEDKRIKLIAYQKEWIIADTLDDGSKVARSVPVGDPVSRYTWNQFCDLGGRLYRITDPETGRTEETDKTFDELFPNLEPWNEVFVARCSSGRIYSVPE